MGTKLFVGNLSFNTSQNQLQDAFSQHGVVVEVALMLDRETGRSRGFAFVTMDSEGSAQAAIQAMNGTQLDGRALTVNEAKPKEERPRGGGGYGGGRGGGGGYGGGGRGGYGGGGDRGGYGGGGDRGGYGGGGDRGGYGGGGGNRW